MITPAIRGGHEVTLPVAVEGAEVGDAIAIRIRDIEVTSLATASGNDRIDGGPLQRRPVLRPGLPGLRARSGEATRVEGIGPDGVRCAELRRRRHAVHVHQRLHDRLRRRARGSGVTVGREQAEAFARRRARASPRCPTTRSRTRSCCFAPHDLVALATRLRPFMGQLGTSPSIDLPDSHNAGDFGAFLVGAPHRYAPSTPEQLERHRPTATWTSTRSAPGAILVCPVKVAGRRRLPRRHARACRATARSPATRATSRARSRCRCEVLKGLAHRRAGAVPGRRGPAVPGPAADGRRARARPRRSPRRNGVEEIEESLPISVVGTGPDLNSATDNGLGARGARCST